MNRASPRRTDAPARPALHSWLRWLPWGLAIGIALTLATGFIVHPFLEARARQALAQATMMSACMLDWSRRRELPWQGYAAGAGAFFLLSFAAAYLLPR